MKASARLLVGYRYWSSPPISSSVPQGIFARIAAHDSTTSAVVSSNESYGDLTAGFTNVARHLAELGLPDSYGAPARIGLLQKPGTDWIRSLLGIWRAGYIAVPLSPAYPEKALVPLLDDAGITTVIGDSTEDNFAGVQMLSADSFGNVHDDSPLNVEEEDDLDKCRMLLYTSGTTGNPKGVIWSEKMVRHHVSTLSRAWAWSDSDVAIAALPLHHVHGIVNVILTALYSGAALQITPKFQAERVWRAIMGGDVTVFMGVPTMYRRLLEVYQASDPDVQAEMRAAARNNDGGKKMRLFVTGSAVLPLQDAAAWAALTGSVPLERYGMTETGMILSNPYESRGRVPASLGMPLPGTQVRISETDNMLWVKGDGVSPGYWPTPISNNENDDHGWFETGDIVEYNEAHGTMQFVGRASVDIVKSAGYKVSALEVENMARCLGCVDQVAVVGVPDTDLGERIIAYVVVTPSDTTADEVDVRRKIWKNWKDTLPKYKVPRNLILVDQLPRNQLGKVQKVQLKQQWAQKINQVDNEDAAKSKMQQ